MRRTGQLGDLMVWGMMGLGAGLLAGFALAEAVGAVDRERVARAVARIGADPLPSPLAPARAARAAERALAEELGTTDLGIEVRPLGRGQLELLGWVPDRQLRALAERTVTSLRGITLVVNRLLVTDEDSTDPVVELSLADRSA